MTDPVANAQALHKAIHGLGTDNTALITLITQQHPATVASVYASYANLYGETVDKAIAKDTSGNFGRLAELLSLPREVLIAKLVHGAVKGLGTKDVLLIDVASSITPEEAAAAAGTYKARYGKDIISVIKGDTTGSYEELIVSVFSALRASEGTASDVGADISLIQGGKNSDYVAFFGKRARSHIALVIREFERTNGAGSFEKKVASSTAANFQKLCVGIARSCMTVNSGMAIPIGQLIHGIRAAIKGLGTDEKRLNACVALAAPYYGYLPMAYEQMTKHKLNSDITGDTTANYEKLLLRATGCVANSK